MYNNLIRFILIINDAYNNALEMQGYQSTYIKIFDVRIYEEGEIFTAKEISRLQDWNYN